MNAKHRKTLAAVLSGKTPKNMPFRDVEPLLRSLGCDIDEAEGAMVIFYKEESSWTTHRPHPGKEAREYHFKQVRIFLGKIGIGS